MLLRELTGEVVIVIGAAVIVIFSVFASRQRQAVAAGLALATCGAAAGLIAHAMATGEQELTMQGVWSLDRVARSAELLILAVTALTIALSPEWLRRDVRHGEWYALLLFSAAGAMAMASASDSLQLVVGVLLSSATGYVLAAYHRRSALSVEAGAKYFLIGALANVALLTGVAVLFGLTGTTRYAAMFGPLDDRSVTALVAVVGLVTVALAFKIGAVPAHAWVPDVAQGAPAPAAAFLTVVPKVGGLVALARILAVLPDDAVGWRLTAALLAAITMTVGNLAALWQDDVRRLLGWSSVSQAGFALMAVPVVGRSDQALTALMVFLVAYAVAQLAAFGVVTELRGRTALGDYHGLAASRPLPAVALVVALLSLIGVPPLIGFSGKLLLFTATIDGGYAWLAVVGVANTVISLFYYLRVIAPVAFDRPRPRVPAPLPLLGQWSALGTAVASLAVVGLGLGVESIIDVVERAQLLP